MDLPRRHQGVLLSATRSCDESPKPAAGQAGGIERHLTAYLRGLFLVPADDRELDIPGAFMRRDAPAANAWKASELGHLPQHYYSHLMHAFQVVGCRHPDHGTRLVATAIYNRMVHNMHLIPEPRVTFERRLTEDRIASGNVVS
jgi:hypothetical protein